MYSGSRRQRGGGILGALARIAMPMAKRLGTSVLRTAKKEGLRLGANVVSDLAQGRSIKDSLVDHGKTAARNISQKTLANVANTVAGNNNGRKRRRKSVTKQNSKRPRINPKRAAKKRPKRGGRQKQRRNF